MSREVIVEMTPFIFEDGNIYYFSVFKRSNNYHDLYVYKKVLKEHFFSKMLGIKPKEVYEVVNERACLVDIDLNLNSVKREIRNAIVANQAVSKIKDWDGFVGDVPEELKVAIKREANLKSILKE